MIPIILISAVIIFFYFQSINSNYPNKSRGIKFTGIITDINTGCWADGICSIRVGNKWIAAEYGGLRPPDSKPDVRGQLVGISFSGDTQKYIGKTVEVHAQPTDGTNFTIYGDNNYFIRLLE